MGQNQCTCARGCLQSRDEYRNACLNMDGDLPEEVTGIIVDKLLKWEKCYPFHRIYVC